jgi:FixJ family two-component response regulator
VMPGMKGPELARRVAMERDVPVLFVSGYAEELVETPDDLESATSFLAKPFTPEQLLDAVHKMTAVSRTRSARPPSGAKPAESAESAIADERPSSDSHAQWSERASRNPHPG